MSPLRQVGGGIGVIGIGVLAGRHIYVLSIYKPKAAREKGKAVQQKFDEYKKRTRLTQRNTDQPSTCKLHRALIASAGGSALHSHYMNPSRHTGGVAGKCFELPSGPHNTPHIVGFTRKSRVVGAKSGAYRRWNTRIAADASRQGAVAQARGRAP